MTYIAFRALIKSDQHERFVFRCFSASAVMQLDELMLQHPLAPHSTFNGAAVAHLSRNTPLADKIIEKRIFKGRRRAGSKHSGSEEQKQDHCRSRSRKHEESVSLMVFQISPSIN